ncbi:MAG TPA: hypothetical protein DCW41_02495 [Clostridiales bacterium]|nr:hypothetical protein [Clostridiales bacterium]
MSRKHYFWISAATVTVLSLILIFTRGIVLETVDDFNVMYSIAGYKTEVPFWQLTFFNSVFAGFISIFYRITGAIQWYSVIQFGSVFVGEVLILYSILCISKSTKKQLFLYIGLFSLLHFSVYMYVLQRLQFTTTAGVLGAAAICMLYMYLREKKALYLTLSGILIFGSVLMRYKAGLMCFMIFFGLFIAYTFLERNDIDRKVMIRSVISVLLIAATVVAIRGADLYVKRNMLNENYMDYDHYRGMYQDYKKPDFNENQELYNSVGWDDNVYNLAANLIYIDPAINEHAFKTIVESDAYDPHLTPKEMMHSYSDFLFDEPEGKVATGVFLFMTILAFTTSLSSGSRKNLLLSIYAFLAWAALTGYLLFQGRMVLRVMLLVLIPSLTLSFLIILSNAASVRNKVNFWQLTVIPVMLVFSLSAADNVYIRLKEKDRYSQEIMFAFEEYAMEHPDNIYIHDYTMNNFYNSYSAFHTYDDPVPSNVIMSGGSYTYSACYYKQLEVNNLTMIRGTTLFHDNVYYVCDLNRRSYPWLVYNYLESRYGNIDCRLVEELDDGNVGVFKFSIGSEHK